MTANTVETFWSKVKCKPGCWEWQRGKDADGYGMFSWKNRLVRAHRFSYELAKGPIPDGLEIRHKCDNPSCVRPSHLLTGSQKDNANDRDSRGRGLKGRKLSPEHIKNSADARRGKVRTPEQRARMKAAKQFFSTETRRKISDAQKRRAPETRLHSENTKRKIGDAHRGMKRSPEAVANMVAAQRKKAAEKRAQLTCRP